MVKRSQPIKSSILKCGKRTFFFDVNKSSNDKLYLKITESAFVGDNGERRRNTFFLFPEETISFQEKLQEAATALAE